MGKSNYLWLLDPGHGGIDADGNYTTGLKKMYDHGDFKIYEGEINREITLLLCGLLDEAGVRYVIIPDIIQDTPLSKRVQLADEYYRLNKDAIFLSIHSNAGGGHGNEIYTSPGQTKSDKIAQIFAEVYQKNLSDMRFRKDESDHDDDKEAPFYVLRKTDCPALLVENGFFDNRKEAELLMSIEGQIAYAEALFDSIQTVEKLKPI